MRGRALAALAVLAMALGPMRGTGARAQDALALVRRAGSAYRALSSLQADFRQAVEDAGIGDTLRSTGRLYQAGANSFAMRFTDPPDEAVVIDGRHVWVYTPSTAPGQVIRMPMETDPVYGANLLARILDRPAERYRVESLPAEMLNGRRVDVVSLVPRSDNLSFLKAVLWLDQDDALPRRIELTESRGVRRILQLSRLVPNAPIPVDIFQFRLPKGVRIVDQ
jgi:outer membrane lipoprotein carrier protein